MWSSEQITRRSALAAGGIALLASCGFTPAYGPSGSAEALLGQISMPEPRNANEVKLIAQLEERIGAARPDARFALVFDLTLRTASQGINPDQETTRVNIIGRMSWRLRETNIAAPFAQGVEESFTSYSTTANTAATLAAEEDATDRLMVILADQLVNALVLATADHAAS